MIFFILPVAIVQGQICRNQGFPGKTSSTGELDAAQMFQAHHQLKEKEITATNYKSEQGTEQIDIFKLFLHN